MSETPQASGLHQKYQITKANGEPCDPNAIYFVLRLDNFSKDHVGVEASREAAIVWAETVKLYGESSHLYQTAKDLIELVNTLDNAGD